MSSSTPTPSTTPIICGRRGARLPDTSGSSRFYVRCHARPSATFTRTGVYSLDDIDVDLRWAMEFESTLAPEFEFAILGTTPTLPDGRTGHDGTALMIMCQVVDVHGLGARSSSPSGRAEETDAFVFVHP